MGVAVVEDFSDGVPGGAPSVAKGFFIRCVESGDEDVADVSDGGGLLGRDGSGCDSFLKIVLNRADIAFIKMFPGKSREMTGGRLGVCGTMQGVEVGGAEALMIALGELRAVAAVGKGKAAEGKGGIVCALARHYC